MTEQIPDDEFGPFVFLEAGGPLGIAFYPDHATKADLISRMGALGAPRELREVGRAEDALGLAQGKNLIVVDPDDEVAAVRFLDRNRDHFEEADARVLLLLLRGGAGEAALADAPALASFAREASFEVSTRRTHDAARELFVRRNGITPEEWLGQWRGGALADTLENNHTLAEALVLTTTP